MVKVKDLISALQKADPECYVYMESDEVCKVFPIHAVWCGEYSCYLSDKEPDDGVIYHETLFKRLGAQAALEYLDERAIEVFE